MRDTEKLTWRKEYLEYQAIFIEKLIAKNTRAGEMRQLVLVPIPKCCGNMQLSIRRNKSGFNKFYPKYTLIAILKDENGKEFEREIMIAKKRGGNFNHFKN